MLQPSHHFHDFSLDSLQYIHVFLVLGSSDLDKAIPVWTQQYWEKRKNPLLWPTRKILDAAQDIISHLWHRHNFELAYHKVLTDKTLIVLCYRNSEGSRYYRIQIDDHGVVSMTTVLNIKLNCPKKPSAFLWIKAWTTLAYSRLHIVF